MKHELAGYGAHPSDQRVVRQGKIWTAAGVSAGIDLALTLVAEVWGPEVSRAIRLGIEYNPQPAVRQRQPQQADPDILALVKAISAEKEAAVRAG